KTFWGEDLEKLSPSNRRAVVPGAWRIEVSPREPSRDDVFLHVLEIGDRGAPPVRVDPLVQGKGLAGAIVGGEAAGFLATCHAPLEEGESTLPDVASASPLWAGLVPRPLYAAQAASGVRPGEARVRAPAPP